MLKITHSINNEICILNLEGELVDKTFHNVKQYLESYLIDLPFKVLVFNFKKINKIDSMGIGSIVAIHLDMKEKEKTFGQINLSEGLKNILYRMNLNKVLNIFDTEEDALNSLT